MKTHTMIVVVLSAMLGAAMLLNTDCSTAPSGGGGSGGGSTSGTFSVANEYIDFHSWYGELTWSGSSVLNPALIVVSSSKSPKSWDGSAALGEQGKLTAAGIAGVSVEAVYSRKFDGKNLKTRKVYIPVTDEFSSKSISSLPGAGNYMDTGQEYAAAPWLMRPSKPYYVHVYYTEGGASKTFTHSFTTSKYPSNEEEAKSMFRQSTASDEGDNSVATLFAKGHFNLGLGMTADTGLERKANEPVYMYMNHYAVGAQASAVFFRISGNVFGSCPFADDTSCTSNRGKFIRAVSDPVTSLAAAQDSTKFSVYDQMFFMVPTKLSAETAGSFAWTVQSTFHNMFKYYTLITE